MRYEKTINIGNVGSTYKRVYETWLDIFSTVFFHNKAKIEL